MFRIIVCFLVFASLSFNNAYAFSIYEDRRSQHEIEKRLIRLSNEQLVYNNKFYFESKSNLAFDASNSNNRILRNNAVADFSSNIYYNSNWFAMANIRMEEEGARSNEFRSIQVSSANGNDRFYEDHYADLRQLLVGFNDDRYRLYAGKFTPKFGYAWQLGRGAYTDYLPSSYMQRNRIGIGGELKHGNARKNGRYNLGLSFYKYDRKYFDNSVFSSYRNVRLPDAVPSAGNNFDSFTVNLDIDFDFLSGRDLFYRFAYSKQTINDQLMIGKYGLNRFADQESYSLAMNHKIKLKNNMILDKLIEYKDGNFAEGIVTSNKDNLLTLNAILKVNKNWVLNTSHSNRRVSSPSGLVVRDSASELSFGYDFAHSDYFDGLQLQCGYAKLHSKDRQFQIFKNTDSLFLMLRYVKNL